MTWIKKKNCRKGGKIARHCGFLRIFKATLPHRPFLPRTFHRNRPVKMPRLLGLKFQSPKWRTTWLTDGFTTDPRLSASKRNLFIFIIAGRTIEINGKTRKKWGTTKGEANRKRAEHRSSATAWKKGEDRHWSSPSLDLWTGGAADP